MNTIRKYSFGFFAFFNSLSSDIVRAFYIGDDLTELKKRNAELMLENNLLRNYALQNLELKSQLKIEDTSKVKLTRAKVVSKLVSSVQGNLVLNLGMNNGIKKGMPVINDKGLVGIINDVGADFSLVKHINNSYLKIAVKDQRSGIDGILNWDGNKLIVKNIQGIDDILIGDRIVTSDFSTLFPPNIPVGIVKKKESSVSGFGNVVIIEPFVNLDWLSYVFIIPIIKNEQLEQIQNKRGEKND